MIVGTPTKLNLIPSGVMPVVYINQGDAGYDKEFLIYNGDTPYNVSSGVSATIRGTKADNYGVTEAAEVTTGSNLVTVTITEQMVAAAGENVYELVFVDTDGLRVASINMIWAVKKDALGDSVISDSDLDYVSQAMDRIQGADALKNQIDINAANIAENADDIAAETSARISADLALQANISSETAARTSQDSVLQAEINQLVAPTGSAPSAAEVQNARIGADGVTYSTLGGAIRTQVNDLNTKIEYNARVLESATENVIDQSHLLENVGWAESSGDFYGPINNIYRFQIAPITIKPTTQYTLSLSAYNESGQATGPTGLIVYIMYTDGSYIGIYYPNSTSSFTRRTRLSDATKTIRYIWFENAGGTSAANDTWHIKDLMLAEGSNEAAAFVPFELTAIDLTARADIVDTDEAIRAEFSNVVKYSPGLNLFDVDAANRKNGILTSIAGAMAANAAYNTVFLPVDGGKSIACNTTYTYISFYSRYTDITKLSAGDTITGNLGGVVRAGTDIEIPVPAAAKYMAVSYIATRINIQINYGSSSEPYEPYEEGIPAGAIFPDDPIVYDIYADGSGDFANIRICLESITDASERKKYEVHLHEGTYNIEQLFTAQEIAQQSVNGLFVPNYVTLVGIGNRDSIILSCVLSDYSFYFSALHFRNYGGMKNLTVTATKCRYTVHDDLAVNGMGGERLVENCKIIGNDLEVGCVYGSGLKEGAKWKFKDTIIDARNAAKGGGDGLAFLSHNQLGWTKPSEITFENCRIQRNTIEGDEPTWKYAMRFRSLTSSETLTWNNMPVYVHFYGTLCNGIELGEDNLYGSGIAYYVDGYSNKNAWEHVTSTSVPPITVADRFDLIGSY